MGETRERRWTFWHWLGVAVDYLVPLTIIAVDIALFGSRLETLLELSPNLSGSTAS